MATIAQTSGSPAEAKGIIGSQDYAIKTLNLLTANGQKMELKKLLISLDYYEDIFTFVSSGSITLMDAQGFPELLQLTGNEFIEINFGKYKDAPTTTDQIFRVYKMGERKPGGNLNTQTITLYFCSEELLLSEQTKISKSYSGLKITDIIYDILTEQLKVSPKKINKIEETTGVYDFLVPRLKPFEAISWVSTYARPAKTDLVGADMLFFETKEGFNFKSIQSMSSEKPYETYKYQLQNLDKKIDTLAEKLSSIMEYEFTKAYDALGEITKGTFASRLLTIDPLTRSYQTTDYDYSKFQKDVQTLNENVVTNDVVNRLGKSINQAAESVFKFMTSNANQNSVSYIREKPGGVAKDIYAETFVPQRTAQLALTNYNVIKLTIPGDSGITAGRTVMIDLPTIQPNEKKRELDKFYSGKYLVTAVRHMIGVNSFQTVLEVAKDSSPTAPQRANQTEFKSSVTA
jgi:hypothetical protein